MDYQEKGVEEDLESESREPFNPNEIRVTLWTPTIDLLLTRIEANELELAADFQRDANIWTDKNQSRLIESLLIRIPLPAFYVDGSDESKYIVIDGIQRLTAMKRFMLDKDLLLEGLEFLTDLDGKSADQLPRSLVRRIRETMVTVYIVEKGTPERARLNIFKRINTGGVTLSSQEIRHAINPGPVREWLKEMASSAEFLTATHNSISKKRMDDRECVARFVTFIQFPPESYSSGDLNYQTNKGMEAINKMSKKNLDLLATRFKRSMTAASELFETDAFRKRFSLQDDRKPINKALFEAWSVSLDACSDDELKTLIQRKEQLKVGFVKLMNRKKFENSISLATSDVRRVRERFDNIQKLIKRTLA